MLFSARKCYSDKGKILLMVRPAFLITFDERGDTLKEQSMGDAGQLLRESFIPLLFINYQNFADQLLLRIFILYSNHIFTMIHLNHMGKYPHPEKISLHQELAKSPERQKRESCQSNSSRKKTYRKRDSGKNNAQSSLGLQSKHEPDNFQFSDYCFEGGPSVRQKDLQNLIQLEEQNKSGRENQILHSEDYGVREMEILSRKKVSNYRYLMTQLKQLIKLKKLQILIWEKKQVRTRIIKLENQIRKLKLTNRKGNASKNFNFSQKSKYLKKLKSYQSDKGNSLHKNYLAHSYEFLNNNMVKGSSNVSCWMNYEEQRKKILFIRLEMLKKSIKSNKKSNRQKEAYLKFELDILKNETQLVQSEINKNTQIMKSQSIRFSQLQRFSQKSEHLNTKRSDDQVFYSPKMNKHKEVNKKGTSKHDNEEKIFKRKLVHSPLQPLQKIVSH